MLKSPTVSMAAVPILKALSSSSPPSRLVVCFLEELLHHVAGYYEFFCRPWLSIKLTPPASS